MIRKLYGILALVLLTAGYSSAQKRGLTFLHTSGYDMVNEAGEKVFLKGVGLGNWLLPEGYMWKFEQGGDRPRKIEQVVEDLIGKEQAGAFWKSFRQNYITEADINRIAELGFNAVRPAINARVLLSEDATPVYKEEGFQLLDSLVAWCGKYRVYVILDMHGAPGGQTGANIDDSRQDVPELFTDKKYQDQLVDLWMKIVNRYKDNPVVAAYDLLNEPLPEGTGAADKYKDQLLPLYKRIRDQIRTVDQKHMITLEGYNWANNWSLFEPGFDSNVFYQFHYYCWNRPDHLNDISSYLEKRKELNTPVWAGETGEKGNTIYWATSQYFESSNIGFSFWPWKKMDTKNTPYSIKKPANWDLIVAYTKNGTKPGKAIAEKAFQELLQNIKLANCVYFEDVCNAIMNRIPGKIEAENYGHDGYNTSYYVSDTTKRSAYYRTGEPVTIELDSKEKEPFLSEQSVLLHPGEWVGYKFNSRDIKEHLFTIRASAPAGPATVKIYLNGTEHTIKLSRKDPGEIILGKYKLNKGANTIKVMAGSGDLKLDWLKFK